MHRRVDSLYFCSSRFIDVYGQLEMTEKQLREQLDAVYTSTSWKITAPLRFFSLLLKSGGWRVISPRKMIFWAVNRIARQPRLRALARNVLRRFPRVACYFRKFILDNNLHALTSYIPTFSVARTEQDLTPHAFAILSELRAAIERQK